MIERTQPWYLKPCPCDYEACSYTLIEPNIVGTQGVMIRLLGEYIVNLHNKEIVCTMTQEEIKEYYLNRVRG